LCNAALADREFKTFRTAFDFTNAVRFVVVARFGPMLALTFRAFRLIAAFDRVIAADRVIGALARSAAARLAARPTPLPAANERWPRKAEPPRTATER